MIYDNRDIDFFLSITRLFSRTKRQASFGKLGVVIVDPFFVSLLARVSKNYLHVDNVFLSHYSQRLISRRLLKKKKIPLFRILIILRSIIASFRISPK